MSMNTLLNVALAASQAVLDSRGTPKVNLNLGTEAPSMSRKE